MTMRYYDDLGNYIITDSKKRTITKQQKEDSKGQRSKQQRKAIKAQRNKRQNRRDAALWS